MKPFIINSVTTHSVALRVNSHGDLDIRSEVVCLLGQCCDDMFVISGPSSITMEFVDISLIEVYAIVSDVIDGLIELGCEISY